MMLGQSEESGRTVSCGERKIPNLGLTDGRICVFLCRIVIRLGEAISGRGSSAVN